MKTPIEKIRRQELSVAAFQVMTRYGLSGTTISRVAEQAGMSQGLVHHYFKGKSDLLEAAMREVIFRYRKLTADAVRRADTPRDKVLAIVKVGFVPEMFRQHFAQAWLSFCGEAAFNPQYARVQRFMFNRMESNLAAYLRPLLPAADVRPTARLICMQSHGIWLRCALDEKGIDMDDAVAQMSRLVDLVLGPDHGSTGTAVWPAPADDTKV